MDQEEHPIFEAVRFAEHADWQQMVNDDPTVLDQRLTANSWPKRGSTPLMVVILHQDDGWLEAALWIVDWIVKHKDQHDIDALNVDGESALHQACGLDGDGPDKTLLIRKLVAAGANPGLSSDGMTPMWYLVNQKKVDHSLVGELAKLPAVRATIDLIDEGGDCTTVLGYASSWGHTASVKHFLDAGADPTIPDDRTEEDHGLRDPLTNAISEGHFGVVALLRSVIAEPDRVCVLYKARSLLVAAVAVPEAAQGESTEAQEQKAIKKALKERVERGEALPQVELAPTRQWIQSQQQQNERLRAVAAFAVGIGDHCLPPDLFKELGQYIMPKWGFKGPQG